MCVSRVCCILVQIQLLYWCLDGIMAIRIRCQPFDVT